MAYRRWTQEELEYLKKSWGATSRSRIAHKLGRTDYAVQNMAYKIGLGGFLQQGDYITLNQLMQCVLDKKMNSYQLISWVEKRGMPVKTKVIKTMRVRIIYIDDFWKWAEKNRSLINFSKFEENALGKEPEWVKQKRKEDFEHRRNFRKTPWTSIEDAELKHLLNKQQYTWSEVSSMMQRTEGAIQRRCTELGVKDRPIKADNHNKWSKEEIEMVADMIRNGKSYEVISSAIGRSTKAIRGKCGVIYGTENLDKIREKLEKERKA